MRHFYPAFVLLLLSTFSFSQSIDIHTSYVTPFDLSPRWRLGVEYNTNPGRFAYNLDVGYGNYALNKFRVNELKWGTDYKFLEIRPEVKYFFAKDVNYFGRFIRPPFTYPWFQDVSLYAGVELFFLQLKNTFQNDHYILSPGTALIGYESSLFHKRKFGGHIKYGAQYIFGRLVIDNSMGIGIAHRNRFSTDTINPEQFNPFFEDRGEFFTPGHRKLGKSFITHFTFNLKVGFILWRK